MPDNDRGDPSLDFYPWGGPPRPQVPATGYPPDAPAARASPPAPALSLGVRPPAGPEAPPAAALPRAPLRPPAGPPLPEVYNGNERWAGPPVGAPAGDLPPQDQYKLQQIEQAQRQVSRDPSLDPTQRQHAYSQLEGQARQIDPHGAYRNGRQPMTQAQRAFAQSMVTDPRFPGHVFLMQPGGKGWLHVPPEKPQASTLDPSRLYLDVLKAGTIKDTDGNTVHPSQRWVQYHVGQMMAYHGGLPAVPGEPPPHHEEDGEGSLKDQAMSLKQQQAQQKAEADRMKAAGVMTEKEYVAAEHSVRQEIDSRIHQQKAEQAKTPGYTPALGDEQREQAIVQEKRNRGLGRDYVEYRHHKLTGQWAGNSGLDAGAGAVGWKPPAAGQSAPQQPAAGGPLSPAWFAAREPAAKGETWMSLHSAKDIMARFPGGNIMAIPPGPRALLIYHLKRLRQSDPSIPDIDYARYGVEEPRVDAREVPAEPAPGALQQLLPSHYRR